MFRSRSRCDEEGEERLDHVRGVPNTRRIDDGCTRPEDDASLLAIDLLNELALPAHDHDELIAGRMRLPTLPIALRLIKTYKSARICIGTKVAQIFDVVMAKVENGERLRLRAEMDCIFE